MGKKCRNSLDEWLRLAERIRNKTSVKKESVQRKSMQVRRASSAQRKIRKREIKLQRQRAKEKDRQTLKFLVATWWKEESDAKETWRIVICKYMRENVVWKKWRKKPEWRKMCKTNHKAKGVFNKRKTTKPTA